jgi:chemotaxis protein CheY-P-specific phosphatase CheC
LVSDSADASTIMSGVMPDPEDKSTEQKLDFLMDAMNRMLGQLTTMNGRL